MFKKLLLFVFILLSVSTMGQFNSPTYKKAICDTLWLKQANDKVYHLKKSHDTLFINNAYGVFAGFDTTGGYWALQPWVKSNFFTKTKINDTLTYYGSDSTWADNGNEKQTSKRDTIVSVVNKSPTIYTDGIKGIGVGIDKLIINPAINDNIFFCYNTGAEDNGLYYYGGGANTKVVFLPSGKVLINTTVANDGYNLFVNGNAKITDTLTLSGVKVGSRTPERMLVIDTISNKVKRLPIPTSGISADSIPVVYNAARKSLYPRAFSTARMSLGDNATTANINRKLHVYGSADITDTLYLGGAGTYISTTGEGLYSNYGFNMDWLTLRNPVRDDTATTLLTRNTGTGEVKEVLKSRFALVSDTSSLLLSRVRAGHDYQTKLTNPVTTPNIGVSGYIPHYTGAGTIDTTNFQYDAFNRRLGLGMIPLKTLDVAGGGRFTGKASSTLTGTADPTVSTTLVGTGTLFTTELVIGDRITVNAETRTVTAIASDVSLTVSAAFTNTPPASVTKLSSIFTTRLSDNTIGMVQDDRGYVGIGMTPTVALDVAGTVKATTHQINGYGFLISTGGYMPYIGNYSHDGNGGMTFNTIPSFGATNSAFEFTNGSYDTGIRLMTILGNGYVGIGMTPTVALDVAGTVKATTHQINGYGFLISTGGYMPYIGNYSHDGNGGMTFNTIPSFGATNSAFEFTNGSYDTGIRLMTILGNGYVGIGTTTPVQKLEIEDNTILSSTILLNGDFTTNTASWTTVNSTFVSTTGGQSGNYALLTNTGASAGYAYQTVTTIPNARYILTYYFQKGTGVSGKVYAGTSVGGSELYNSGALTDTTWAAYTIEFIATTTTTTISCVNTSATINQTSGFDTFTLKEVQGGNIKARGIIAGGKSALTLGAGATTFAITTNVMKITGDGGGNTITKITGGITGQILILIFVDAYITITDDNSSDVNTINLLEAFTSDINTVLTLVFDGVSWREVSRSKNG